MSDSEKTIIRQGFYTGERALFGARDLEIYDTIFDDGESPLKESRNIRLDGCMFKWKYPLWYTQNINVEHSTWFEMARAGVWYTRWVTVRDALIEAPKNFRRCRDLKLSNVSFSNAAETLWHCKDVRLENVNVRGDYFGMDSDGITATELNLIGNYGFDSAANITITNSRLLTKDAFWNCENVLVKNSFITGEYLAWNSKNVVFEDCVIESLQGLCYVDNLKMFNCRLINTTLAFEYSTVDADIHSRINSVLNPSGGIIRADSIDELIIEKDKVDPSKTTIIVK